MVVPVRTTTRQTGRNPGALASGEGDPRAWRIAAADALLQTTGQKHVWEKIRQNNDGDTVKIADLVLERHNLLAGETTGRPVDWNRFDAITGDLAAHGIRLWDKETLLARRDTSRKTSPSSLPATAILHTDPAAARVDLLAPSRPRLASSASAMAASPPPLPSQTVDPVPMPEQQKGGAGSVSEPDFLVLQLSWSGHTLTNGLGAYGNAGQLQLPLSATAGLLGLFVETDPEAGTGSGRLAMENGIFSLDMERGVVTIDGVTSAIPEGSVLKGEDDLYVDARTLSTWLPADFDLNYAEMSVAVAPRQRLPFQENMDRHDRWDAIHLTDPYAKPRLAEAPVGAAQPPTVDLSIAAAAGSDTVDPKKLDYTLSASGTGKALTTRVYVTGDENEKPRRMEVSIEKTDAAGTLPFGMTRMAAGDVAVPEVPILSRADHEQGLLAENRPLAGKRDFDTTRFQGNLAPGWEVELYRGEALLNAVTVGAEGRYDFDEVPVFYGDNAFRLVFYGPEGQRREVDRTVRVGTDMVPKGEFHYSAALTRKDTITAEDPLVDIDDPDDGEARGVVTMEYGLTDRTSLFGGVSSESIDGERHTYLHSGVESSLAGASIRFDGIKDTTGGHAFRMVGQTAVGETRVRLKQEVREDFFDEADSGSGDPVTGITELSLSGHAGPKTWDRQIPYTLTGRYTDREESEETRVGLQESWQTGPVHWNHATHWIDDTKTEGDSVQGFLHGSGRLDPLSLRGQANYRFEESYDGVDQISMTATFPVKPKLDAEATLRQNFDGEDRTGLDLQMNWDRGGMIVSPRLSGDTEGEWEAYLGANMAIGPDPHTESMTMMPPGSSRFGNASVRVFEDQNLNGEPDPGEPGIAGVMVRAVQAGVYARTDNDGVARLRGMMPHQKTDVAVSVESLEDPAWHPTRIGASMTPKPGEVRAFSIPVIRTGEIDGTLYRKHGDEEAKILRNTEIRLLNQDGEVVETTRSEFDGFYLFTTVPPGNYSVEAVLESGERIVARRDVAVGAEGTVESGMDLVLEAPSEKTVPETEVRVLYDASGWPEDSGFPPPVAATGAEKEGAPTSVVLYGENRAEDDNTKEILTTGSASSVVLFDTTTAGSKIPTDPGTGPAGTAVNGFSQGGADRGGAKRFGLHVSSYRRKEDAVRGIQWLRQEVPELRGAENFRIQKTDLGTSGTWYRVTAGAFSDQKTAEELASRVEKRTGFCRVQAGEAAGDVGVHLASYRTLEKAEKGLALLSRRHETALGQAPMAIRKVDLGEKGVWFRIVAGTFPDEKAASGLREAVIGEGGYAAAVSYR